MSSIKETSEQFDWNDNLSSTEWDELLANAKGHPLQSAQWGNSRKSSDNIKDLRWAAYYQNKPIYVARFEERRLFGFIKIAWVPRGPIALDSTHEHSAHQEFLTRLKNKGFFICATNPWKKVDPALEKKLPCFTIWLDLTIGKDQLWSNLHKQFRYDVRRAKKLNVTIEKSKNHEDILSFYELCKSLSRHKGFPLCTSIQLMSQLLKTTNENFEAYIFTARHEEKFCGGAFVIRYGENVHYIWGAVDRSFSRLSVGEAIQWEVIEWALSKNCKKYDLEGIDPKKDTGVNYFKKKIGGELIAFPSDQLYPLHRRGKILSFFLRIYLTLLPSLREYKKYLPINV